MQQHEFQMSALASTRLRMCQTPQQTAEMNPSHCYCFQIRDAAGPVPQEGGAVQVARALRAARRRLPLRHCARVEPPVQELREDHGPHQLQVGLHALFLIRRVVFSQLVMCLKIS